MPVSPRLAKALQQALGEEASGELLAIFATKDSEFNALRGDIAELRHEMQIGFEKLRSEMVDRIERRFSDQLKWSFVFWVGAVTTLAVVLKGLN